VPPPYFKNFFGLFDNPFNPSVLPVAGDAPAMLVTLPLILYEHPELHSLYSDDAGPFRQHEEDFRQELELNGYSPVGPSAGTQSYIFLIAGPEGSGKTTLMSAMVEWLERCRPQSGEVWKRFDGFQFLKNKNDPTFEQQEESLNTIADKMSKETQLGEYCCLIVDDYLAGIELRALDIWDQFKVSRKIALFLTPAKGQSTDKLVQNSSHEIHLYHTSEIDPDQALAFVRTRIDAYRDLQCFNCQAHLPLFPFADHGIKDAVKAGVFEGVAAAGSITIRQLGKTLSTFLVREAKNHLKSDKSFNIAGVPCPSLEKHLIDPSSAYDGLRQAFARPSSGSGL